MPTRGSVPALFDGLARSETIEIGSFRIVDKWGLVEVFASQADVGKRRNILAWNVSKPANLAPLICYVVFVGE